MWILNKLTQLICGILIGTITGFVLCINIILLLIALDLVTDSSALLGRVIAGCVFIGMTAGAIIGIIYGEEILGP